VGAPPHHRPLTPFVTPLIAVVVEWHERAGDPLDDAARDTACRVLASLEQRDRRVIAEISATERRLSAGSFGVCEMCVRPIPFERLRALPTARLCVVCEAMAERVAHR